MNTPDVKICGLTCVDDALQALDAGADYLGFVLYPKSPRYVAPSALERLRRKLPASARCIGVFVNSPADSVVQIVQDCELFAAQLAGEEMAAGFLRFRLPLWRTVRTVGGRWVPGPGEWPVERFVVDASGPEYGGSGRVADWARAGVLARAKPVMLAGGLTPENVAVAVRTVRPAGVDVSSGVESEPGRKDPAKVRKFIQKARGASSEEEEGLSPFLDNLSASPNREEHS